MPGRPMTEEQNLPSWLFVFLSLARGLKFDDVERTLSYAGPFLAHVFVRVMQLTTHTSTLFISKFSVGSES